VSLLSPFKGFAGASCTYETWDWDTVKRRSVHHRHIQKDRSDLSPEERGLIEGCTVCAEDQEEVRIGSLPPFQICRAFKERITRAIKRSLSEGFPITSVIGYRVGRSKGAVNSAGQRTQFSHHSFGTAIDFNAEKNGLYDFCLSFGPQCQRLRGGPYVPGARGTITRDTPLYRAMISEGFRWGGEIKGKQKDFMHFSMDGM
jgi:hypothetical protein